MDRYTIESNGNLSINNHPMGRIPELATDGSLLYYLDGGELAVDIYSADGALVRRIRGRYGRRLVTDDVIDRAKTAWLGGNPTPDQRRSVERIFARMELPEVLPAATALMVDPGGYIWVGEYSLFGMPAESWQVFDADGTWLGVVQIPPGLRVVQVGEDFALGVMLDEFGVERLLLFRLLKPE
jgi:hypothetical protein